MAKKIDLDSLEAVRNADEKGWNMVDGSAVICEITGMTYGEAFAAFNLEIDGVQVFSIDKKRVAKYDSKIKDYDPFLDSDNPNRLAKIAEMAEYYEAACKAAEVVETAALKKAMEMRKSKGLKALSQDQKEEIMALASEDVPGHDDDDDDAESED